MKRREVRTVTATALTLMLILQPWLLRGSAEAKIDCSPVTNKSNDLPRVAAIGTNPAGTGAHSGARPHRLVSESSPIMVPMRGCRCCIAASSNSAS